MDQKVEDKKPEETVQAPEAAAAETAEETPKSATEEQAAAPEQVPEDTAKAEKISEEATKEEAAPAEAPAEPALPDWKGMYARMTADFDNFRKRTAREREDLFKSAASDILKDILPTVDNLGLALEKAADKEDPFVKGVKLVYDGLLKMLADHGATPIDSLGEPLDTNFHEAIATLPSPEVPEGHVMNEVKRGWLLNGKLLRVAQVVVSAGKGA